VSGRPKRQRIPLFIRSPLHDFRIFCYYPAVNAGLLSFVALRTKSALKLDSFASSLLEKKSSEASLRPTRKALRALRLCVKWLFHKK